MAVKGIDRIVYGVEDMENCRRFFADWGLKEISASEGEACFETLDGSEVGLRPADATNGAPPIEPGSTLREIIWGVDGASDLEHLADKLAVCDGFQRVRRGRSPVSIRTALPFPSGSATAIRSISRGHAATRSTALPASISGRRSMIGRSR